MKEMEGMKHDQNMGQKISGKGTVQAIDAEAKTMTMAHEPIPALQWPAMTMTFNLQSTALTQAIEVNDKVDFEFKQTDGGYTITSIEQQD